MSTATRPQTVKDLLLPGDEPPPELTKKAAEVAGKDGVSRALDRLTLIGLDILGARIGKLVGGMLGVEIGGVVGSALTKNQAIAEAMRDTAKDPKAEAVVPLADHKLESKFTPSVDVLVDDVKVTSIPFEVSLETKIEGALVVVKGGHMSAVRSGRAKLTATLTCEGVKVVEKKEDLDFAGMLKLPSADTQTTKGAAGPVVAGSAEAAVAASAGVTVAAAQPAPRPQPTAKPAARAPAAQPVVRTPAAQPITRPAAAAPAAPPQAPPPVGWIQNGWRFTASGQWERVTHYLPGDIVNGHRLNAAGNAWEPLPPG